MVMHRYISTCSRALLYVDIIPLLLQLLLLLLLLLQLLLGKSHGCGAPQLARVHDPVGVERPLDVSHHAERRSVMLQGEQPELAVADAVLPAARAPGGHCELGDGPAELLGPADLLRGGLV